MAGHTSLYTSFVPPKTNNRQSEIDLHTTTTTTYHSSPEANRSECDYLGLFICILAGTMSAFPLSSLSQQLFCDNWHLTSLSSRLNIAIQPLLSLSWAMASLSHALRATSTHSLQRSFRGGLACAKDPFARRCWQ